MRGYQGLPDQPNRQELESSASASANRYPKMISSFVSHGLLLENTRTTKVHTNQNTEKRQWHEDCQITPSEGRGNGLVKTQMMQSHYWYYMCYHWVLPNHLLARGKVSSKRSPAGTAPLGPTEGSLPAPGPPPPPPEGRPLPLGADSSCWAPPFH